ncbi:hypothetical protein NDU88_009616 [Pleurodeles waltl]|uniref:Uncharacterized protein n=1 Tax=Pleurodeles waltl TaxID=8319 RepID=A0AAV7RVQ7_PLEWA|nr:hypothetical protein NDU88_009616 [Pleurodeles waltl]
MHPRTSAATSRPLVRQGKSSSEGASAPPSSSGPQHSPHRTPASAPSSWATVFAAPNTKGAAGPGPTTRLDPPRTAHIGFRRGPMPDAPCPRLSAPRAPPVSSGTLWSAAHLTALGHPGPSPGGVAHQSSGARAAELGRTPPLTPPSWPRPRDVTQQLVRD